MIMIGKQLRSIARIHEKRDLLAILYADTVTSRRSGPGSALRRHINAAYQWLCVAQDASPDNGVSASYSFLDGWKPSYPETTGYIIPTFFELARYKGDEEAHKRALLMADWEIGVQLATGAVQGGHIGVGPAPVVFNTGQVLFGLVAAFQETGQARYVEAAQRAADWLVDVQDDDGAWRRHVSIRTPIPVATYNARSAWGLVLLGQTVGDDRYITAGRKNLDWCLTQQNTRGWFANNAFRPGEAPLLHTIGYVVEGMLEAGLLIHEER